MVYKSLDSLDPRKVIFSASCCSVENGSQHHPSLDITKKYFMLDIFCSVGSQHGLDLRVTKNIFCLHFFAQLENGSFLVPE